MKNRMKNRMKRCERRKKSGNIKEKMKEGTLKRKEKASKKIKWRENTKVWKYGEAWTKEKGMPDIKAII